MRSTAGRRVIMMGLLAIICLTARVEAKTIVVESYDTGVSTEPARYLIDHSAGRARVSAMFRSISTTPGPMNGAVVHSNAVQASFGSPVALSDLYKEGRRIALNELHARDDMSPRDDSSKRPADRQGDVWAMLLVGVVLIAQQLRRKHRSLKQSLIAG
jgi:hypothetical protein